jgi:glycosyltransferase involved in cell wall biosynthesis
MIQGRLDVDLLAAVADRLPQVAFALVGVVTRDVASALRALPGNVHLLGPRRHDALPAMIAACDACMVPHRRDALTASMDPLKLYEYLAAGKPVVTTVASPNPALEDLVRVATTAETFAAALLDELAGDDEGRRTARRLAVAGQTWAARADRVLVALERAVGGAAVKS